MKCLQNMTFKIWNVSKTWRSKHEMFKEHDKMKCFRNVTFKTWNISETRSFKQMFRKCNIQSMKCFKTVTYNIWNITKMWHSKHEIFQIFHVQNMKCFRSSAFKIWNISETQILKQMIQKRDVHNMNCFKKVSFTKHCSDTEHTFVVPGHICNSKWKERTWKSFVLYKDLITYLWSSLASRAFPH